MNNLRIPGQTLVLKVIGHCLVSAILSFAYGAFQAHGKGLEHAAFWDSTWRSTLYYLPFVLLILPIAILLHKWTNEMCKPEEAGSPVEDGIIIWQHRRILFTIIGVPPLITFFVLLYHQTVAGNVSWSTMALCVFETFWLIYMWIKPNPEKLYVMSTGDTSRINDEHTQEVKGKAAVTTLDILWRALLSGGILYEMAVLGTWPVRTAVAILIISLTQGIATRYWDKRL